TPPGGPRQGQGAQGPAATGGPLQPHHGAEPHPGLGCPAPGGRLVNLSERLAARRREGTDRPTSSRATSSRPTTDRATSDGATGGGAQAPAPPTGPPTSPVNDPVSGPTVNTSLGPPAAAPGPAAEAERSEP